ncbi:hypothetical protein ATANTOWER_004480 [Ataeniobius toweri]|uniref:Uncharacterized protein n=1 Tax=Ataeniobius toweri TaxID=208326 RepID=A0ABU7B5Z8_9TELE|nr:hypothetical protein [Ataeniobius toweri]
MLKTPKMWDWIFFFSALRHNKPRLSRPHRRLSCGSRKGQHLECVRVCVGVRGAKGRDGRSIFGLIWIVQQIQMCHVLATGNLTALKLGQARVSCHAKDLSPFM